MNIDDRPRRIAIVGHRLTTSESLAVTVSTEPGFECVGVTTDPVALADLDPHGVDALLVTSPENDGGLAERLHHARSALPDVPVILLTDNQEPPAHLDPAPEGTSVLTASSSLDRLVEALRTATDRRSEIGPAGTASAQNDHRFGRQGARALGITARQHEVLGLLAEGRAPAQVARDLGIKLSTCRDHIKALHRALDCTNRAELLLAAVAAQLVAPTRHRPSAPRLDVGPRTGT